MAKHPTIEDLQQEVAAFRDRFPNLTDEKLFVVWFLRARVTECEDAAADAVCDGPKDKNIDAVLIDDATKSVFIVQGKYRKTPGVRPEKPNDVRSFAQISRLIHGSDKQYDEYCTQMAGEVEAKLSDARKRILGRGYGLQLYYVTLGRCSSTLVREGEQIARNAGKNTSMDVIDGRQILTVLEDYLNGVAPPVPSLDLEIESGNGVEVKGILQRFDRETGIESWVFPMASPAVASLVERAGQRLFARNIRGFLGNTEINKEIENTLKSKPQYFWYYNNGITIVCDRAEEIRSQGRQVLRVGNPQVINGQQTSRTLHQHGSKASRASTLVKVIRVPRSSEGDFDKFDLLVSDIVSATNWQNKIVPSDLRANDRRQIMLERELRKIGYWYIRKRQTKGEAKRMASSQRYVMLKKEELAQAVAGCELDPVIPRTQREGLFEDRLYPRIFSSKDPWYYLTRYRLLREVKRHSRGTPDNDAKWLVLHTVWEKIAPTVRSRAAAGHFSKSGDQEDCIRHLSKAINAVFLAAKQFYHANKRAIPKVTVQRSDGPLGVSRHRKGYVDVPTFFKRRGLHVQFAPFWERSPGFRRFERAIGAFAAAVEQTVAS